MNEPKFDLALNAELQRGLVLLSHCRGARGIGVRPFRAATVCEFEPALETDPFTQSGSDHGSRSCKSSGFIKPRCCDSRSLPAIFSARRRDARQGHALRAFRLRRCFASLTPVSRSPFSPPTANGRDTNEALKSANDQNQTFQSNLVAERTAPTATKALDQEVPM